jgi:hypothetical protein
MAVSSLVLASYLVDWRMQVSAKVSCAVLERGTNAVVAHWAVTRPWDYDDILEAMDVQLSDAVERFMEDSQSGANVKLLLTVEVVK